MPPSDKGLLKCSLLQSVLPEAILVQNFNIVLVTGVKGEVLQGFQPLLVEMVAQQYLHLVKR